MYTEAIHIPDLPGTTVAFAARGQGYFPVICALDEDECVVALRGGAGHIGLGGRLDLVRSTDRGASWSAPVTIADSERDDRNREHERYPEALLEVSHHVRVVIVVATSIMAVTVVFFVMVLLWVVILVHVAALPAARL